MAASKVTNVIAATELAFARNAAWTWILDPAEFTYAPQTTSDPDAEASNTGVSVLSAVSAFVLASVRYAQNQRTVFAKIGRGSYDSTADYEVILNGTDTYTTTGETTAVLAVADLVDQINAAASTDADPRARAVAGATDGVLDTLCIYALGDPATSTDPVLTVEVTTTNSDGVATAFPAYGDPEGCSIRIWGKFLTPTAGVPSGMSIPWVVLADADVGSVDPDFGYTERINVSALERLYVQVYDMIATGTDTNVTARPSILIGTAIPET